ncbi:hypothetical protein ACVWYH_008267 [Bradyrhizobium sp. GM24.11]
MGLAPTGKRRLVTAHTHNATLFKESPVKQIELHKRRRERVRRNARINKPADRALVIAHRL